MKFRLFSPNLYSGGITVAYLNDCSICGIKQRRTVICGQKLRELLTFAEY
jgi:hypothetical protein